MKTALFFVCFIIVGCFLPYGSAHGAEISKADIIATVEHLRSLTHDAQAETTAAKAETATIQQASDKLKQERDDWKDDDAKAWAYGKGKAKEAHDNAKQRDVVIWAFALAFAGLILRAFPLPGWFIVAEGALSLACGYATGRFALAWLASLMP
jgi:hypothetical protein